MINEKKNVKFFQQSKDGRAELANTKFLDSKLNLTGQHYITKPTSTNQLPEAGTWMQLLHQSRLPLSQITVSMRNYSSSKLFHWLHSISISPSVTSQLHHSPSLSDVGRARRIHLHKSKLIPSSHSFTLICILHLAAPSSLSAFPISLPSLALVACSLWSFILLSISCIFSVNMIPALLHFLIFM